MKVLFEFNPNCDKVVVEVAAIVTVVVVVPPLVEVYVIPSPNVIPLLDSQVVKLPFTFEALIM